MVKFSKPKCEKTMKLLTLETYESNNNYTVKCSRN